MSKFALRPALTGNYKRACSDPILWEQERGHLFGLDDARSRRQPLGGRPKRMMDVMLASLALVLLAPIMLMVAGLVRLVMGGPAIFAHKRVGFGGRTFACYKFRTTVVDGEKELRRHLAADPDGQGIAQAQERPEGRLPRQHPAQVGPRRAAAIVQCPARRHEPGRAAAGGARGDRALRPPRAGVLPGQAGADRACGG